MHAVVRRTLCLLLLVAAQARADWYETLTSAAQRAADSVVRIRVTVSDDREDIGTGVYVYAGLRRFLVTALHVTSATPDVFERTRFQPLVAGGPWRDLRDSAVRMLYYRTADLAVFELSGPLGIPGLRPVSISNGFSSRDQQIFTVGSAPSRASPLLIGRFQGVSVDKDHFSTGLEIEPGDSGAPSFSWEDGEFKVVGIMISRPGPMNLITDRFVYVPSDDKPRTIYDVRARRLVGHRSIGATLDVGHLIRR